VSLFSFYLCFRVCAYWAKNKIGDEARNPSLGLTNPLVVGCKYLLVSFFLGGSWSLKMPLPWKAEYAAIPKLKKKKNYHETTDDCVAREREGL